MDGAGTGCGRSDPTATESAGNSTIVNADYGIFRPMADSFSRIPDRDYLAVVGEPDLSITKSGPATAFVEHFSYDLTVTNNGAH